MNRSIYLTYADTANRDAEYDLKLRVIPGTERSEILSYYSFLVVSTNAIIIDFPRAPELVQYMACHSLAQLLVFCHNLPPLLDKGPNVRRQIF